ncbi:hypothetical protein OHC33_003166 [Knufia fluminis]|uniref:DUF221-domain-containing protein n=1 Tax=Knufia fluminis TaxID=191047 RepID=A0AAN8FC49_9EURO|nr:hypothetical protein OHC33_003166 [Knufia fluminis]
MYEELLVTTIRHVVSPRQDAAPVLPSDNPNVERTSSQSAGQFAASLVTGIVTFAVQFLIFLLIKDRLARIYQPRTYLVPPRERTDPAEAGWFKWVKSVLSTSNSEFVQKCGLDAYFFLRYLRTLLKIFVPAAFVLLPVLIPLNSHGGRGPEWALTHDGDSNSNVTGLNQLAWGNVKPENYQRYWGHWLMALSFVVWICYVAFDELKNYIRMRQAYITSPQHRLRASATTVLVSSIPPKWCTVEALDGLYDVFPGGIRNIWINRNFDELNDKVKERDKIARQLESAETDLIKKCYKKNEENIKKAEKEAGKKITKEERKRKAAEKDARGQQQADTEEGVTSGDPHQVKHTIQETLGEDRDDASSSSSDEDFASKPQRKPNILPVPVLGEGIQAVTEGINKITDRFRGGVRGVGKGVNGVIDNTNGFVPQGTSVHDSATTAPTEGDMGARIVHDTRPAKRSHHNHPMSPKSPLDADGTMDAPRDPQPPENDRRPLNMASPISPTSTNHEKRAEKAPKSPPSGRQKFKRMIGLGGEERDPVEYPTAFNKQFEKDDDDAVWRRYIQEKDRDTHRLPIFGWQWMFALPFCGQKVDTIFWCRKELARLNVEIEDDQANPERFPLMNSAFIQFNHQVAAHMACQSLSHHLPKQMAPRLVEIDPNDVIWDNMSIPWWQDYIRTALVVSVIVGMIILWAIPIAFTSAVSQLTTLADKYSWLGWLLTLPSWFRAFLQGVLPIILLALLMFLLPLILRMLSRFQGIKSGMLVELSVQKYYFFFIFVQLFLIVTLGSSAVQLVREFTSVEGVANIPNILSTTIPTASNYFFSYMLLQALSVSAGALLQVGSLIVWFILAPILDSTARAKFKRQTNLNSIQWGTFFPVYTNLACIGIIYSIISPLILVFNIITFSLFWFVYRYNTLYVTRFTLDTGGLLYPNAINCTFVGVYVLEVALIGLFFLVRDENGSVACEGQAIGTIVMLILTAGYQILLNNAFSPLFRYLPITLEDDAVRRDEEFARATRLRHNHHNAAHEKLIENEREDGDIEDQLEENERRELEHDRQQQQYEMKQISASRQHDTRTPNQIATNDLPELAPYTFQNPEINMDLERDSKAYKVTRGIAKKTANALPTPIQRGLSKRRRSSWADRSNQRNRRSSHFGQNYNQHESDREMSRSRKHGDTLHPDSADHSHLHSARNQPNVKRNSSGRGHLRDLSDPNRVFDAINNFNPLVGDPNDLEAQRKARAELSDALYSGINDELEDLSPEQRDALVQRAFQHSALRARRPVIWIPRDELGVSDDEVRRIGRFAKPPESSDGAKKDEGSIWVSNVRQGLDSKGRCVYSGAPPDFSEVDLIQL